MHILDSPTGEFFIGSVEQPFDEVGLTVRFNFRCEWREKFDHAFERKVSGYIDLDLSTEDDAVHKQNLILSACSEALPVARKVKRCVPWWSAEISALRGFVAAKRRSFQKMRSRAHIDEVQLHRIKSEYTEARNAYKKKIESAKRRHWQDFVGSEGNRDPWSHVYRIISEKVPARRLQSTVRLPSGVVTRGLDETVLAVVQSSDA